MSVRLVAALVVVTSMVTAGRARAQNAPRLDYVVHEGIANCPSEAEFRQAVVERLGRDPFAPESERKLLVEVRVENGELSATGALVEANGHSSGLRRMTGEHHDCAEVVHGMALAASLALDALHEQSRTEDVPAPAPKPVSAQESPKPPVATPTPRAPRRASHGERERDRAVPQTERLELGAGVFGHGALGVGPGFGAGGSLAIVGARGRWTLALEGRFDGVSTGLAFERRGSASTSLIAGTLSPCRSFGVAFACGVGLIGRIEARSSGITSPGSDSATYLGAGGRLGIEWPWSELVSVQGRLDLLATLLPVDIELGNEVVWSSPPVSGALGAGIVGMIP